MTPQWWLRIAGLGTWLISGLPVIVEAAGGSSRGPLFWVWLTAFVGFGLAFLAACLGTGRNRLREIALLVVQTSCALALVAANGDGFAAATLVVVAGQLLWVTDFSGALAWVAVQTVGALVIFWFKWGGVSAIAAAGAYGGFQLFALAASALALREKRSAEALARVNVELTATRELLAENSRVAERLRISRDLHDTLGHHLTALSLQLDVASRLSTGPATEHISQAHAIARLLLSDVRDVVSSLRDSGRVEIAPILRDLARPISSPTVHLDVPDDLSVDDPGLAQALVRAVQEIITNANRHAGAQHLWIRIWRRPDGIALDAHDDGRGTESPSWGNGLLGMRERFLEYSGQIDVVSAPGQGFAVQGFLPIGESRA